MASKFSLSDVSHTNNDGDFTADQIAEFREVFNWFDKDKDGYLNGQQVGDAMRALGENPTNAELTEIIDSIQLTQNYLGGLVGPHVTRTRTGLTMDNERGTIHSMSAESVTNTNTITQIRQASVPLGPDEVGNKNQSNGNNKNSARSNTVNKVSVNTNKLRAGTAGAAMRKDNKNGGRSGRSGSPSPMVGIEDSDMKLVDPGDGRVGALRSDSDSGGARVSVPEFSYKIDFSQFLIMMAHKMQNPSDEREIKEAFALFDDDGSGMISKEKLIKVMTTMGETLQEAEIKELLAHIHTNGKGQMQYEELLRFMLR